jgi:hypothetical protein
MADRRLVLLDARYPDASRSTLWRLRNDPHFPIGVALRGRLFFYEDELETYERLHRRKRARETTAAQQDSTTA